MSSRMMLSSIIGLATAATAFTTAADAGGRGHGYGHSHGRSGYGQYHQGQKFHGYDNHFKHRNWHGAYKGHGYPHTDGDAGTGYGYGYAAAPSYKTECWYVTKAYGYELRKVKVCKSIPAKIIEKPVDYVPEPEALTEKPKSKAPVARTVERRVETLNSKQVTEEKSLEGPPVEPLGEDQK